jgi:hypothetical protein
MMGMINVMLVSWLVGGWVWGKSMEMGNLGLLLLGSYLLDTRIMFGCVICD